MRIPSPVFFSVRVTSKLKVLQNSQNTSISESSTLLHSTRDKYWMFFLQLNSTFKKYQIKYLKYVINIRHKIIVLVITEILKRASNYIVRQSHSMKESLRKFWKHLLKSSGIHKRHRKSREWSGQNPIALFGSFESNVWRWTLSN